MDEDLEQRIQVLWQGLKQRYSWTFIADEEVFLTAVRIAVKQKPVAPPPAVISQILQQQYYQRLYTAVVDGRMNLRDEATRELTNRACAEIYTMAWRLVRFKGYDEHTAEEIAQKVVERLIARPDKVRKPGALFAWIGWQIRDFLGDTAHGANEDSIDAQPGSGERPIPALATADPSGQIEDRIMAQKVLLLLPSLLSAFQQRVIDLVILQDYRPREAAALLQTTPHHVRVEKSRALEIMRGNPLIRDWLRND